MGLFWLRIVVIGIIYPFIVLSVSIDSLYLESIHRNISDFTSFDNFYRRILADVNLHRSINIVSSPINIEKIRSNNYDEDYLKTSCYETASDLLYAHGYNITDLKLSINDIQSLLPAVLYSIENPGCKRALPPSKRPSLFDIWIIGLILIVIMKSIHLIIFFVLGDHLSVLTSRGMSKMMLNHGDHSENSTNEVRILPMKYHLWLALGFNAFTCGIILGTIIYHLIPHIYGVPNEDFDYIYLLRGTIVLCGVFLFFIVEKILRFRFKTDESINHTNGQNGALDIPMAQINEPPNMDNINEETGLQNEQQISHHHNHEYKPPNLILYNIIYDFSNDIIYGCGLATALAYDRLIGIILCIVIFSEGIRRHSRIVSLGRKRGFSFILLSTSFLILGYIIGANFIEFFIQVYIPKEYIYSIVYGALFYTALVILIPELNDFSEHLQIILKTDNQTSQQRHLLKSLIFLCQNFFLLIGVLIALIFAIIWRYYHRQYISEYICKRDPLRSYCAF